MNHKASSSYPVIKQETKVELEIKRSKFLSFACRTETTESAATYIKNLRGLHPQANHVCWAYIVGSPDATTRSMSDDGEPSGTAGMPMLKVLEHSGLGDITVAIVRYFGGTKLGTGGLQRAYSDATSLVLKDIDTQEKVERTKLSVQFEYSVEGAIQQLMKSYNVEDTQFSYDSQVSLSSRIDSGQYTDFCERITNICHGKLIIRKAD